MSVLKNDRGESSAEFLNMADKLWLPSCIEVGTTISGADYVSEGSQYPIFTDNNSRIKMYNESAASWWLRSPDTGNSIYFRYVNSGGGDNNNANNTNGVA